MSKPEHSKRLSSKKRPSWTKNQIDEIKSDVRKDLAKEDCEVRRLKAIHEHLLSLESDNTSEGQLKRLVYVMSSLVHHEKYGGLEPSQVNRLAEIAHVILRVRGIEPIKSTLSFLYGDLHLVLSQIRRKEGEHWLATWEQQLAHFLSKRSPSGGEGFQALAMGNRALRLGHISLALEQYENAEKSSLPSVSFEKARMGRIKALRISGLIDDSERLAEGTAREVINLTEGTIRELEWEAFCRGIQRGESPGSMVQSVKKNERHYLGSYLLEANLWARCFENKCWLNFLPTMRTLSRDKELSIQDSGSLYHVIRQLELFEDNDTPFAVRLQKLGALLSRTNKFLRIDLEVLFWAATAKLLARENVTGLSGLVLREYQALSMRLSWGKSDDVLGLGKELSTKKA